MREIPKLSWTYQILLLAFPYLAARGYTCNSISNNLRMSETGSSAPLRWKSRDRDDTSSIIWTRDNRGFQWSTINIEDRCYSLLQLYHTNYVERVKKHVDRSHRFPAYSLIGQRFRLRATLLITAEYVTIKINGSQSQYLTPWRHSEDKQKSELARAFSRS